MRTIDGIEELRALAGQEIGISDWVTITQERIDDFSRITEDPQWIHTDVERAKRESPYGVTIAHGFLTLSLIGRLRATAFELRASFKMAINYGLNRVRFSGPVPAGSRIRGRFTIQAVDDIPGGVQFTYGVTVEVDGASKPALVAEWLGRGYY